MRKELMELSNVLPLIEQARDIFCSQTDINAQLVNDIADSIVSVNSKLFGKVFLPEIWTPEATSDKESFIQQINRWLSFTRKELESRKNLTCKTDYDFHNLAQYIRMSSYQELLDEQVAGLQRIRKSSEKIYQQIIYVYNVYADFWGRIDLDKGILDCFEDRARQLKEHLDDFCWLYNELADYRSKKVLYGILHFWLTLDYDAKNSIKENNFADYYDFDLIRCDENEVFVDLGAFTGDSALSYIENYGVYKRIYCYEITPSSFEAMQQRLGDYDNIVLRNVGVGSEKGTMHIQSVSPDTSSNKISEETGTPVEIVRLDDDITEPITFIKMDIEGSEYSALEGARGHIAKEKPKLAICTYHNNHHIWEIPRKIKEIAPDYKLYMRYNGSLNGANATEYVTFAL